MMRYDEKPAANFASFLRGSAVPSFGLSMMKGPWSVGIRFKSVPYPLSIPTLKRKFNSSPENFKSIHIIFMT
ncbi:hypothetical protein FRX31_004287 [Thalictrum thalictroides]|uniref:Uncharacterized protein n=1 Tax=Thalictrum thalictroides TaxID=46969 RepID=A0A7J6X8K6_THATH|nr:hypothetical protein FRX31_004287 [Thalictrum thalictroides]